MCVFFFLIFLSFFYPFISFFLITKIKTKLFVSVEILQPNFVLFLRGRQIRRPCRLIRRRSYFGLSLLLVVINLVFKCLLNLRFIFFFLLGNKRLLLLLTSTTRKTATEKRALTYLPLTLRVSVCSRPSLPSCNSEDFPHLDFTDRHSVTNNEFVTYTNKSVQYIG